MDLDRIGFDKIADPGYARKPLDRVYRRIALILLLYRSIERRPSLADRNLKPLVRNEIIPFQGVDDPSGNLIIGAFRFGSG